MGDGISKKRRSSSSIEVDSNVRCKRIYPVEGTAKQTTDLQTIGFKLTRDQAIHLARVLLAVSQDWTEIDITGYRFEKRKSDSTYRLTVTSSIEPRSELTLDPGGKMRISPD